MKKSLMPKNYAKYLQQQIVRAESKWARKPYHDHVFRGKLHADWSEIKELIKPEKVVCMGCRDGTELFEFLTYCRGAKVVGVDITENIKSIRVSKVHGVSVYLCDFSKLPESWESMYDLVFSNSLDHAYDPHATIKEWHRVCKGHLFIQLAVNNKPNKIEHCFEEADIPDLFPEELFSITKFWQSDTLNVLAEVVK